MRHLALLCLASQGIAAPALACDVEHLKILDPKYSESGKRLADTYLLDCTLLTAGARDVAVLLLSRTDDPARRGGYHDGVELLVIAFGKSGGKLTKLAGRDASMLGPPGAPSYEATVLEHATPVLRLDMSRTSDGEGTRHATRFVRLDEANVLSDAFSVSWTESSGSGYPHEAEKAEIEVRRSLFADAPDFSAVVEGERCAEPESCEASRTETRACFAPSSKSWRSAEGSCWLAKASASSTLKGGRKVSYEPLLAADGRLSTAWVEGKKGDPRGEWLKLELAAPAAVKSLEIVPGYAKDAATWAKNHRVKRVKVTLSDGSSSVADLADAMQAQSIPLASAALVSWVKLEILDIYPGKTDDDTCIAEVSLTPR